MSGRRSGPQEIASSLFERSLRCRGALCAPIVEQVNLGQHEHDVFDVFGGLGENVKLSYRYCG